MTALGVLGATVVPAFAASSWVVTSTEDTDGGCTLTQCTLRAAIKVANSSVGADTITFNIKPAGPKTIVVGNGVNGGLPIITGSEVDIDATSQPGGGAHGIRLDDPDVGGGEHGLVLEGNRITIRGFSLTRFDGWGILVWGGSSERIQGNWIGTSDGVSDQGTGDDGIRLHGGGSSLIGGSGSGEGNLISGGNNDGIEIRNSNDNIVSGNMVGLTANGLSRLPNASTGIEINGTASRNRIGGLLPSERNQVSGNDGIGVQILGTLRPDGSCEAPEYNVVQGNYLGLDINGGRMTPSGNRGEGVAIHVCAHHNTIGGTTAAARNIISGNAADGVELDSTGGPGGTLGVCDNVVQGNYIGLSPSGLGRRDNYDDGVGLDNGSCNNLVGGTEAGARNYIAGNSNDGVDISRVDSNGNVVEGNVIGLGVNNATIHNGWYGVMIRSKPQRNILRGNVISGNAKGGIRIQDYLSYYNEVRHNMIGTNTTGTEARANRGHGIWLFDGPNENLISGNTIKWNSGSGIAVERRTGSTYSTRKNRITDNRMRGNGGLGIDLLPAAGVDPVDGINNNIQMGNNGIDSPAISQATANGVRGTGPPNASVEVFVADPDAGETNGEASTLIDTVTADASGQWCLARSGLTGAVTATATDTVGNTSEFATNVDVAGAGAACGSDTTAPTVDSVVPADGATGILPTTNAEATFSEAMDASTVDAATFTLSRQGDPAPVAATVGYDAAARRATLDPDSELEAGATYTATLKGGTSGARDLAGNPLPADKVWSFTTADATAPETAIDSGPSGTVSAGSASFAFASNEANSTFECSLDGEAFAQCSSPKGYADLSDGSHTFQVSATDAAGNTDATPASQTWTVDTAAPDTAIDSGPSGTINVSDATFTFSSSESGATFECSLDGESYSACASPKSYANLPNGPHTFDVRAKDGADNADATPASRTFAVETPPPPQDTTPPETTIDSGPSETTGSGSASLTFSSSESSSAFECKLDGAAFGTCTSPNNYTGLTDGQHAFSVRAIDAAGNTDPTPAERTWTVDTTAPSVSTVDPADSATGVAAASAIVATFSEAMDASTVDAATFTLSRQGDPAPVAATVGYDAAARRATLDPDSELEAGATYTATLKGGMSGARDLAGNPLPADKVWSFTTADATTTPLFAEDFTGPDGSSPTNWAVNRSAGGTGAGATIQDNSLREDVVLAPTQDANLQYVQARAKTVQPDWSTRPLDLMWRMQTDASTNQTIGAFLAPQAVTGNVSNATDYLRVRIANGQVSLLRRTAGGTPTTIWSGPVTRGSTLRQFELRLDGTNLWLYEGAVGSPPTPRVGPIAHGLAWRSGHLYLHAHNSSVATPYMARFDTVYIYNR